jgi:hypothetical protein
MQAFPCEVDLIFSLVPPSNQVTVRLLTQSSLMQVQVCLGAS